MELRFFSLLSLLSIVLVAVTARSTAARRDALLSHDPLLRRARAEVLAEQQRLRRQTTTLDVLATVNEPFVVEVAPGVNDTTSSDGLSGFEIELLMEIGSLCSFDININQVDTATFDQEVSSASGAWDIAAGAVHVTGDVAAFNDISQPFYTSSITTAYRASTAKGGQIRFVITGVLGSQQVWYVLFIDFILLFGAGHLVWLLERDHNDQFPPEYVRGVLDGIWWAAVTSTTVGYGDKAPTTGLGRIVGTIWMYISILLFSAVTAAFSSAMTVAQLEYGDLDVASPNDLQGLVVATVDNSYASFFIFTSGVDTTVIEYDTVDLAFLGLLTADPDSKEIANDVEVLFYDSSALWWWKAYNDPDDVVVVSHNSVTTIPLGYVLRNTAAQPAMTQCINQAIISLTTNDPNNFVNSLNRRWILREPEAGESIGGFVAIAVVAGVLLLWIFVVAFLEKKHIFSLDKAMDKHVEKIKKTSRRMTNTKKDSTEQQAEEQLPERRSEDSADSDDSDSSEVPDAAAAAAAVTAASGTVLAEDSGSSSGSAASQSASAGSQSTHSSPSGSTRSSESSSNDDSSASSNTSSSEDEP